MAAARVLLRILATTDLHAEIRPFDYAARRADPSKGLSRAASVIARLSQEVPNRILLDNGDFLFGRSYGGLSDRGTRGVVAAMNTLGYDAGTLGNHEFDAGVGMLESAMAGIDRPLVCANLFLRESGAPLLPPDVLIRRDVEDLAGNRTTVRIGVVGFLPPSTMQSTGQAVSRKLIVAPVGEIAAERIADLRARGADLVIALCHEGLSAADGGDLARQLAGMGGIDAMVLGHSHGLFPGPGYDKAPGVDLRRATVMGVPTVMPGFWGRHVGQIDLALDPAPRGWRVVPLAAQCHPVARLAQDRIVALVPCAPAVLRASAPLHAEALRQSGQALGRVSAPMQTYFTRAGSCRATRTVARAMRRAVERKLVGTRWAEIPVVGLAAPSACGGRGGPEDYLDLPAGPVFDADLRRLHPFSDRVAGIVTDAGQLTLWLERSVSALAQVLPGRLVPSLVDPEFPAADFDLPEPATFRVDLSRPASFGPRGTRRGAPAGRVHGLELDGAPLDPRRPVVLATTAHRVNGGAGFPRPDGRTVIETDETVPLAIQLLLSGPEDLAAATAFRLDPLAQALALFQTGPAASLHRPALPGIQVRDMGVNANGYLSYLLAFGGEA